MSLKASLLGAVHVTFMSMNSSAQMLVIQLNEAKIFEVQCVITLYVYMLWQGTLCIRSPIAHCILLILPYNTCTIYHCLQLSLPCHTHAQNFDIALRNACQCTAQPNTTLLDCILYLMQYPYDLLGHGVSLGKCILDRLDLRYTFPRVH